MGRIKGAVAVNFLQSGDCGRNRAATFVLNPLTLTHKELRHHNLFISGVRAFFVDGPRPHFHEFAICICCIHPLTLVSSNGAMKN